MRISVRVIPRSNKSALEWEQGAIKARLKAPPVDGAANQALIELLAERLAVPRRAITIVRGTTSRQKTVEIEGVTVEEVERKIGQATT
ncbi:MAG TPA: DUF167 domain-containing protein [Ktedonosporobacter sp.]|jgi:uncharacterized protein (TIGR00251 family)|nr:DUF167 domain-containing protein [Ktedonosporobacter sp.]